MEIKEDKAIRYFNNHFNCAQAVLAVFAEKYNLNEELALKITSGLGAGFRSGEICGAVSGAILVIGLKYGQSIGGDIDTKQHCNAKAEEFIYAFGRSQGSIICRELLGCDLSTEEGRNIANKESLFKTVCEEQVRKAVNLLEELGY